MTNLEIFCKAVVQGVGFTTVAILTIAGGSVIIGVMCIAFGKEKGEE